jgi:tetratricopeptide (TPR) repeat protein
LKQFEAVNLFIERARSSQPGFALTMENAPFITQVCQQLDGIPLAIELAAARVKALSPQQIAARLDDRFQLLTGGSRIALPRQQTLQATMDWSFQLLSPKEQNALCRLSVFANGWSLEGAEAVCAGEDIGVHEVLDLLTHWVDKSLVVAQPGQETRYRLLETVRQYAKEKLLATNEHPVLYRRHVDWFVALAERAEPELRGAQQAAWLEQLEREHDNLRAALEWSLKSGESELATRLAGACWQFWYVRGYWSEAHQFLEKVLAQSENVSALPKAKVLSSAGILASFQGDYGRAQRFHQQSLALWRAQGSQRGIAISLDSLGAVAFYEGKHAMARSLLEESLGIKRELGDQQGIAVSLGNLGNVAFAEADYTSAHHFYEQSLFIYRGLGDRRNIAISLHNLGNVAMKQGDHKRARSLHEESLAIKRTLGDKWGTGYTLHSLGEGAFQLGEYDTASAFFAESLSIRHTLGEIRSVAQGLEAFAALAIAQGEPKRAAEALRESIHAPLAPAGRAEYDRTVAGARASFDGAAFAAAWAEGQAMALDRAIAYALNPITTSNP